ncbi:MAG: cation efflux system protein [Bacteroidetes bacterium]|nr:MAG: cation efflux system protein [Bacteroidota bacterium]
MNSVRISVINTMIKASVFVLLLSFASCSSSPSATITAENEPNENMITLTKEQFTTSEMKLGPAIDTLFDKLIQTTGYIEIPSQNSSQTGSIFGGKIAAIHVTLGQRVEKGQALVSVENTEFLMIQQDYLETSSRSTQLQQDYDRQKNLAVDNIASQKELQRAQSELTSSLVKLNALKQKLLLLQIDPSKLTTDLLSARISLKAPFSGKVSQIYVSLGQWITAENPAVEVINPDVLQANMRVFEKDITYLEKGQKVYFKMNDRPDVRFEGAISQISPQIDMEKRSSEVIATVKDSEQTLLRPGMFVNIDIVVGGTAVTCLPNEAITEADERYYVVYKQGENANELLFERLEVKPGRSMHGLTEIQFVTTPPANAIYIYNKVFQLIQSQE